VQRARLVRTPSGRGSSDAPEQKEKTGRGHQSAGNSWNEAAGRDDLLKEDQERKSSNPQHVERTIAWLNRCRRLAKDWENLNRKALAFLRLASIRLMLRKLCNPA
jgi:hypothetical protein